jgi:hypothetical protein
MHPTDCAAATALQPLAHACEQSDVTLDRDALPSWSQGVCALFGAIQDELDGISAEALQDSLSPPQQSQPEQRSRRGTDPDPQEAGKPSRVSSNMWFRMFDTFVVRCWVLW